MPNNTQILIVEDDLIVAQSIKTHLNTLGYQVPALETSGEAAIKKAQELQPDLILMDIKLPGKIDGVQAAAEIRSHLNIPVIYLTAYADAETLARAKITEPFGYILKPFGVKDLHSTIEMALYKYSTDKKRAQAETALHYSEYRYKQLLESVTDYIYTVEIEHGETTNTIHGPGCEVITGYAPEEFQANAHLWYHMIHQEDREQTIAQTERLIAGEKVSSLEHRIIHKDGTSRWVRNTPVPRYNHEGMLIGYNGLISDITEQKQAEEEAKTSRDQLESIFTAAPTGIGMVINRHFTFVNEQFIEMLGYSREELIGQSARMIYPNEEEYLRVGQIKYDQIEKKGIGTIETKCQTKDGRIIDILMSSSPIDRQDLSRGVTFTALDITQRNQVQEALRQAELEYRTVADFNYDWEIWQNPDGTMRYVSPSCQRITGYTTQEFIDNPALISQIILPEDRDMWDKYQRDMIEKSERYETQFRIQRKDGEICWIEHASLPVTDEHGSFLGYRASNRDISRRKHAEAEQEKLQDRLLQAQKMEAIGRLTGGIAHDFNNLLTAINGFTELAQHKLSPDSPVQDLLKYVLDSGQRAANLVRQLLAFSRKQIIEPKIIHLDGLIPDLDKMLRRIIGEDIKIETDVAPDTWPIKVDPAQVEQVIINLAVNARDAMPDGGKITITADNATLSRDDLIGHPETLPGEYVLLSIRDTGTGMSNDILANIFEPFFTTKEQGKGTGLGLATVYGIIKQNRGDIWVESREEQGTTFKIYLPRAEGASKSISNTEPSLTAPRGDETILLTEDDPEVRELTRQILTRQGYTVLDTATGKEALHLAKHYARPINLLVTDVVMPDINGKALAEQILHIRPNLKIIFISGYPDETIVKHGVIEIDIVFLQKPFTASQLAQLVRTTLDISLPVPQKSPNSGDTTDVPT